MGKLQHAAAAAGRVFHARVLAELGPVMRVRGLRLLSGGPGDVATLYGDRCLVRLRLDADGEVCCTLNDLVRGGEFELVYYLRLMVRERVVRFLPATREDGCGDVTAACLAAIAAAIGDRALDAPLGGNFSWARDYWLLRDEAFSAMEDLLPVIRQGRDGLRDLRELRWLLGSGNPMWIDEGRRVAGTGSKPYDNYAG